MSSAEAPSAATCPSCHQSQSNPDADFCQSCRFPLIPIANKYRLEQMLNEGGCSHVYLAKHIRLKRNAERVIKIIKGDLLQRDPNMEERFYREVQMTSDLSHQCQHVVRVFDDFGEAPKLGHYYVMEYLQGGTLAELMKGAQELISFELAVHIASQLCDAMYWAHDMGIVHRDLKPANIMLISYEDDAHYVKVLDFGIAKSFAEEHAQGEQFTQGAIGTPTYMAPEHFTGNGIDFRADIYAMGVIFYELLSGRPPFIRQKTFQSAMIEMMDYHLKAPLPPIQDFRPDIPTALADAVHKALEKRPEARYDSAREFKDALQAGLQPEPASVSFGGITIPPASPSGAFPQVPSSPSGSFSASPSGSYQTTPSGSFAATPPPPPPRHKTGKNKAVPPPPPTGSHSSLTALPTAKLPPKPDEKAPKLSELDTHIPGLTGVPSPLSPSKTDLPAAVLPPQPFKAPAPSSAPKTPPPSRPTGSNKISLRLDNRLIEGAQLTMDPQAEPLTIDDIETDLLDDQDLFSTGILTAEDIETSAIRPPRAVDLGSTGVLTADDMTTETRQLLSQDKTGDSQTGTKETPVFDIDVLAPAHESDIADTAIQANPFLTDPLLFELATGSKPPELRPDPDHDRTRDNQSFVADATPPDEIVAVTPSEEEIPLDPLDITLDGEQEGIDLDALNEDNHEEDLLQIAEEVPLSEQATAKLPGLHGPPGFFAQRDESPHDETNETSVEPELEPQSEEPEEPESNVNAALASLDTVAPPPKNLHETAAFHPNLPLPPMVEENAPSIDEMMLADEAREPTASFGATAAYPPLDVAPPEEAEPHREAVEPPLEHASNELQSEREETPSDVIDALLVDEKAEVSMEVSLVDTTEPPSEPDAANETKEGDDKRDFADLFGKDMYHQAVPDDGLLSIDALPDTTSTAEQAPAAFGQNDPFAEDEEEGTLNIRNLSLDDEDPFQLLDDDPNENKPATPEVALEPTPTTEQTPAEATPAPFSQEPVFPVVAEAEPEEVLPPPPMLEAATPADAIPAVDPFAQFEAPDNTEEAQGSFNPPTDLFGSAQAVEEAPITPNYEPINPMHTASAPPVVQAPDPLPTAEEVQVKTDVNQQAVPDPDASSNMPIMLIIIVGGILFLLGGAMMLMQK